MYNFKNILTFLKKTVPLAALAIGMLILPPQAFAIDVFENPVAYTAGTQPRALDVIDFNHDTHLDIVAVSRNSNNVSVFLGTGSGTFGTATNYLMGSSPRFVITGDFNEDTHPDIVAANFSGGNVSVRLSDGLGGFGNAVNYTVGSGPNSVAVSDFNEDSNLDLVVANSGGGSVSILLGTGSGTFGTASTVGTGATPVSVAVADFNNDSNVDIATANNGGANVSILIGNGLGGFAAASNISISGTEPFHVHAADFNDDGDVDIATANNLSSNISVLLGDGNGGFGTPANFTAGSAPNSIMCDDFDGDGDRDFIVVNKNSNNISLLLGDGLGGFTLDSNYTTGGTNPQFGMLADLNHDGKPDFAVANSGSNNVGVLINDFVFPLAQFEIDTVSNQTTDVPFDITITAQDTQGNTITSFTGTVDLSVNSGSIAPATSNAFVNGVLTQTITITGAGAGRTITATLTGDTEDGTSNTFTVGNETVAPTLVSVTPSDDATGVSPATNLTIVFSENVVPDAGNVVIKKLSDDSVIESASVASGQISGSGTTTIVIDPSVTLGSFTEYYVEVDAGAFADTVGNDFAGITGDTDWNFMTSDISAPQVVNVTSVTANGTYGIGDAIDITLTFSEAVTSTGLVTVTLETGTTDRMCTFSITNSTSESCIYTVQAGDISSDLTVVLIGGVISDQSANTMTDFAPQSNLAMTSDIVIDTAVTPPVQPSSSGSSVAGVRYGCKDTAASNYDRFSRHKQSLCVYATAPVMAPEGAVNVLALQGMVVRIGMRGTAVATLQNALNAQGAIPKLVADGIFGNMTLAAVKTFQAQKGLVLDGIVGPKTVNALSGY